MAKAGDVIGGKYRLIHPLGIGGMGTVWRCEHTQLKLQMAVKLLDARGPSAERAVQRFKREAQIAASIRHRNIVYISDFGTDAGAPYLVMELLSGVPLSERLVVSEPLTVGTFLRLIEEALEGLAAVHAAGVVHRDMKPENIFLVRDGALVFPKLLDFGVSRSTERGQGHTITREGIVMGTPEYVAPEQARGRMADARSDLYSLGVVMYEALAGRLPFHADNAADLIVAVLNAPAIPLSSLRPELGQRLSDIVSKAMERDPEARFANCEEMRIALVGYLEATPGLDEHLLPRRYLAPPPTARTTPRGLSGSPSAPAAETLASPIESDPVSLGSFVGRSRRNLAAMLVAAAGAAIAVLLISLLSGERPNPAARAADLGEASSQQAGAGDEQAAAGVEVELFGVPEGARVLADGVEIEGNKVVFVRDSGQHAIEVLAEGKKPWRVLHDAAEGGRYALAMMPVAPEPAVEDAPEEEPPRRARTKRSPAKVNTRRPKLLRTPDF